MKSTFTSPADFWQERDFGAKISAVFDFIGAHWRPLGKCLVYFVLPFALVMGIGLGMFTNSMFNLVGRHAAAQQDAIAQHGALGLFQLYNFSGLGLAMLGGIVAFLLLSGTLYGYLRARLRYPAAQPLTPALVWAELRGRLGRLLLVVGLLVGAYLAFAFALFAIIGLVTTGVGAGGIGGQGIASIMLGFLLFWVAAVYLSVVLSLYFPVLWLEDLGIFASLGRCFQLIKGHWWATLGLLLVAGLLQSTLSIVFVIPQYAVMVGKMMQLPGLGSDVLGLAAQCFYAVGIVFTYTVPLLALAFQYFNLVEQREGVGLHLLVGQLGQSAGGPAAHSGQYRPDEEGEY